MGSLVVIVFAVVFVVLGGITCGALDFLIRKIRFVVYKKKERGYID